MYEIHLEFHSKWNRNSEWGNKTRSNTTFKMNAFHTNEMNSNQEIKCNINKKDIATLSSYKRFDANTQKTPRLFEVK